MFLHYFNPGHETAVLNSSPYYTPAANQLKMQQDLAFLPAWYANPDDYILVEDELTSEFLQTIENHILPKAITKINLIDFLPSIISIDLWGISPSSIYFFQQLKKELKIDISYPEWNTIYQKLCSRRTAKDCLEYLIQSTDEIQPNIIPQFYSKFEDIERIIKNNPTITYLAKAPYSSSGRGLIRLFGGDIPTSERQILSGMLKKQKEVSMEKFWNKKIDFSMQFFVKNSKEVEFIGFSLFKTNEKGAYIGSSVSSQEKIESIIASNVTILLLHKIRQLLLNFIKEKITPFYTGNIGIDMMVYEESGMYLLQPCVEINLRKNMGFLAVQLYEKQLDENSEGFFQIEFSPQTGDILSRHERMKKDFPLIFERDKIKKGYLPLCPVKEDSKYWAYLLAETYK